MAKKAAPIAKKKTTRRKKRKNAKQALLHWPEKLSKSRRLPELELQGGPGTKIRPLKCASWSLALNPDFAHLTVTPKPRTAATTKKWYNCFSLMGHGYNFVAKLGKTTRVLVSHPICTEYSDKQLVFSFMLAPKPVVPVDF
jgi:hypothetical protein